MLNNSLKTMKGELIGNHFNIYFYDNFGNSVLNLQGDKIGIEANYTKSKSVKQDEVTTNYELSSVTTITIDGKQLNQTGNTIIFEETGIQKIKDFNIPKSLTTSGGSINIFDRNINKLKNLLGTKKIIVISSQLGVPIAVYGGNKVYWEIPNDLDRTTKLNIDGKALYVQRANYILVDSDVIS